MIEDEMARWHHQLKGHEFEQTLGDSEGQEALESDMIQQLKNINLIGRLCFQFVEKWSYVGDVLWCPAAHSSGPQRDML